jgi:lysophospholipase L1-like esterase
VRSEFFEKCRHTNDLLKAYLATEKNISFVDVFNAMIKDNKPMPELFVGDMLHMNGRGYKIWEKLVRSKLKKLD